VSTGRAPVGRQDNSPELVVTIENSYPEYDRAQFGQRLRLGTAPAMVVVDLEYGFTDPAYALGADLSDEITATRALLDVARGLKVPVFFTVIAYASELNDVGVWLEKSPALGDLLEGTRATAIDERLARTQQEPVITKKGPSALFGTSLCSMLIEHRVDTVVLCGATTSGCVRATAVDLMQYGFRTVIPRQCVGDRVQAAHESSLIDLHAKYCDVMDVGAVTGYLRSVATGSVNSPRSKITAP
jgi:maleamate amidohydrolase